MNPNKQKVRTHLNVALLIAGKNIGHARLQSFNADHDYGTTPVHGIGDYLPAEHVNNKFQGTIQVDSFAIRKNDLAQLGISALGEAILTQGVIDIEVKDSGNGLSIRTYKDCVVSRYSERIQQGEICGENATFMFRAVEADNTAFNETANAPRPDPSTFVAPLLVEGTQPVVTTTPAQGNASGLRPA